jgi:RNA polymerase sigma-70 factor (ECF subfamily)
MIEHPAAEQSPAEEELARRCSHGDTEAFHALTDRYYRPVCAFLLRRLGRADVVEDVAQDTFLEAFRTLQAGRLPDRFSSWLFGIAHNCAGKWLRRRRLVAFDPARPAEEIAAPPEANLLEEAEERSFQLAALEKELGELDGDTRLLLDLKHREGLTCEQIGSRLGRPVGTIKSLLSRTYKLLRERLASLQENRS